MLYICHLQKQAAGLIKNHHIYDHHQSEDQMKNSEQFKRRYEMAKTGSKELGPLGLLPGKWEGKGTGWNMIALPFDKADFKFRILMNQYDEKLEFTTVSDNVENRGLKGVLENSKVVLQTCRMHLIVYFNILFLYIAFTANNRSVFYGRRTYPLSILC